MKLLKVKAVNFNAFLVYLHKDVQIVKVIEE